MSQDFNHYFKADNLFKLLKDSGVKLIIDQSHNIVAKGRFNDKAINTVVFLSQFEGPESTKLLKQAEMLCEEFGI